MQLRAAISKDGSQVFTRDDTTGAMVQRSNAALHPFLRGLNVGEGGGAQLTRPFASSVWVQRAIKRVAEPIAAVELQFFDETGDVEIVDPALKAFWKRPAIERSGPMDLADFIEATVGWLKMAGESFWLLDDTWLTQRFGGVRAPMIVARPDRMRPILQDGRLAGWEWTDAHGGKHPLVPEQVIHRKFWNPYDDLRGLAEYESARVASESDYLAGKFALNMSRANGDRGVIVVAKGGMPSDAQQAQIVRALREKADAARRGDFRPIFLSGDVAVEDPKVASPDAQFIAGRLQNRHEIFIAFGVPPSMADLVANYSVGQASDRYMLIAETCMPLAQGKLAGGIELVASRFFAGSRALTAAFDFDDHPVMQEVRRERIDAGTKLWDRGVSWDVISEHLDLKLPAFPGSDKGHLPFSLVEVGDEGEVLPRADVTPTPVEADAPAEDPTQMLRLAFASREPVALLQDAFSGDAAPVQIGARSGRDPQRMRQAQAHLRSRGPAIKRAKSKFTKVLMAARGEVLAKLENVQRSTATKAVAADFLFDLSRFTKSLQIAMRKAATLSLDEAGQQLFREVPGMADDVFTMPPARAVRFLDERENLLADVAQDVFEDIRGTLTEGIEAGESTAKLAARVRAKCNGIEEGRALTIAQTETAAAYGEARQVAMDEANIEWKEWLTSGLDTVRESHLAAEGQRVRVNDAFTVGAAQLIGPSQPLVPGDSSPAVLREIINCHCVSIPVEGPGEEQPS